MDQGTGALILFEAKPIDMVYDNSLSIIQSIGKVVDNLYFKVKKLSWNRENWNFNLKSESFIICDI